MSTIHRPAPVHLWWYAAFAVALGFVVVLAMSVLGNGSAIRDTGNQIPPVQPTHALPAHPARACFATRPDQSLELRGICATRVR